MNSVNIQKLIAALGLILTANAFAFPSGLNGVADCNKKNAFSDIANIRQNLVYTEEDKVASHDVMYTDGKDNRDFMSKNVATDDPEMRVDLSPEEMGVIKKTTGHFVCGSGSATADLGNSLDEIILPMHALDVKKGRKCFFQTFAGEKVEVIVTKRDVAVYRTWNSQGRSEHSDFLKLKLKKPIASLSTADLIPYTEQNYDFSTATSLIVISGYQVDWNKKNQIKREDMREPLVYGCVPSGRHSSPKGVSYTSNCDVDFGGSGSKVVVRGNDGRLLKVGMMVGYSNKDPNGKIIPDGSRSTAKGLSSRFLAVNRVIVDGYAIEAVSSTP